MVLRTYTNTGLNFRSLCVEIAGSGAVSGFRGISQNNAGGVEINGTAITDLSLLDSIIGTHSFYDFHWQTGNVTIEQWYDYNLKVCTDWYQVKSKIVQAIDSLGGWANLNSTQKNICIDMYAKATNISNTTDDNNKITHLISQGLTLEQAKVRLQEAFAKYHKKEVDACEARATSDKVYTVISKYLSITDAADLLRKISPMLTMYKTEALKGTTEGEAGEGLFDFIYSTSSFTSTGLAQQGYTTLTGNISNLITDLMDILKYGKY